jgi:hypothetical protein
MAYLLSKQSGNWSSASTWEVAGFTSLTFFNVTTVTTTYTASASATPGAITMTGVWLGLYSRSATPTGTLDVQLWNNSGSVEVALVTVNVSDIPATPNLSSARGIFFKFSSPVTLLAGTLYQIRLRTSASTQLSFWRTNSGSTDWCRIFTTSTTAAPSASDIMFVQGTYNSAGSKTDITVTMDNNNSTLYGGVLTGIGGVIDWVTNSSTELRLNGEVWSGAVISLLITEGIFRMGSTASRIQPGVTASLIIDAGTLNGRRIQVQDEGQFIAAGTTMSYTWTRLSSDVLAGAITATTSVATGWSAGSEIVISPTIRHASTATTVQYDRRTLTSVSGTTLGFSSLTNPHSGTGEFAADIINLTRNCRIQSLSPTLRTYMTVGSNLCDVNLNEVEFINFGTNTGAVTFIGSGASGSLYVKNCSFNDCGIGVSLTSATNFYNTIVDNCVYSSRAANNTSTHMVSHAVAVTAQPISVNSYVSNNCMIFGATSSTSTGISIANNCIDVENNSISGIQAGACFQYGQTTTYIISGKFNNNIARFSGNGFIVYFADTFRTGKHPTGNKAICNLNYGFYIPGSTNTRIDDLLLTGNSVANLLCAYAVNANTKNVVINNASLQSDSLYTSPVGIILSSSAYPSRSTSVEVTFNNCNIGTLVAHTTADIRFSIDSDQDCELLFNNCNLGSSIEVSQSQFMSRTSKVSFQRVDQVNGAHRTYYNNGLLTLDTTIYRSSGKSVRLTPSTSTSVQDFGYKKIPVRQNSTPTVSVWVRKSVVGDGSAYNGSQPRLLLKNNQAIANFGTYDDIVLATASSSNGSWEQLSATLPVTPYEDTAFEVYLECSGTTGWVNVDDWRVSQ